MENVNSNDNNEELRELIRTMPPGFRFVPSDEDIIRFFLVNKIKGLHYHWLNMLPEFDLYGENGPWNLLDWDDSIYVFAWSKNKSNARKQRTCKYGTWKLQKNEDDRIKHEGKTIGAKALLSFAPNKESKKLHDQFGGSWHMSEFSLADSKSTEGFVVCKVTFKSDKKNKRGHGHGHEEEETMIQSKKGRVVADDQQQFSTSPVDDVPNSKSEPQVVVKKLSELLLSEEEPQSWTPAQGFSELTTNAVVRGGDGSVQQFSTTPADVPNLKSDPQVAVQTFSEVMVFQEEPQSWTCNLGSEPQVVVQTFSEAMLAQEESQSWTCNLGCEPQGVVQTFSKAMLSQEDPQSWTCSNMKSEPQVVVQTSSEQLPSEEELHSCIAVQQFSEQLATEEEPQSCSSVQQFWELPTAENIVRGGGGGDEPVPLTVDESYIWDLNLNFDLDGIDQCLNDLEGSIAISIRKT